MDRIVAIVALVAMLLLIGRGLPVRTLLVIALVAIAFSLIVVLVERGQVLP